MDTNDLFEEFNKTIRLSDSKKSKLIISRDSLRGKIRKHCEDKGYSKPKFYPQGSFATNTIVNPIKENLPDGTIIEKYDIDDGVYFIGKDQKQVVTYHDRVFKAVDGHAKNTIDKNTCVRVEFYDGHHIDLPVYWMSGENTIPKLAHKKDGFIDSDPKAFKDWLDNKIASTNETGQLRRIIRYMKAWSNYRECSRKDKGMPSGLILTILCANEFVEKPGRDDLSFYETAKNISNKLKVDFSCLRPTIPVGENLLDDYSEKDYLIEQLEKLVNTASDAIESSSKEKSSETWVKVFGDRFPAFKEKQILVTVAATHVTNSVEKPWSY